MHPFETFLETFIPLLSRKSKQLNLAIWLLETTGNQDAAELKAELDIEVRLLLSDRATYEKLLTWEGTLSDPILERQRALLAKSFQANQIDQKLLEEISRKEAALSQLYVNFRPKVDGKSLTENDIRLALTQENSVPQRKKVWEASKEIGNHLAPAILELVKLRNQAAQSLGFSDYFSMQLDLQEVNREWLLQLLDRLSRDSEKAYLQVLQRVEEAQMNRFGVTRSELGPWAWSEPFCQEDPLDSEEFDQLVLNLDMIKACVNFYQKMDFPVEPIFQRSDLFGREGKNQHAFCINIDRANDVRTLNNVQPTLKWLETLLHELGHAIYEIGFDTQLPWLLREPPHMITTEAMALIAGRQASQFHSLKQLLPSEANESLMRKADESLKRHQLIFSRWVLVMTFFESELYRNPSQDLNRLWWACVSKYQKITPPTDRSMHADWAAKYHVGLAPVYYFSYLLGELFASSIEESLLRETGSKELATPKAGKFLQERLFAPGNRMAWNQLIEHVTGEPLSPKAWLAQFN